jgi:hypothetical protein
MTGGVKNRKQITLTVTVYFITFMGGGEWQLLVHTDSKRSTLEFSGVDF